MIATQTDRLHAVDLRSLSDEEMSALRRLSIRRGLPLSQLLSSLIAESSKRLLDPAARVLPQEADADADLAHRNPVRVPDLAHTEPKEAA